MEDNSAVAEPSWRDVNQREFGSAVRFWEMIGRFIHEKLLTLRVDSAAITRTYHFYRYFNLDINMNKYFQLLGNFSHS